MWKLSEILFILFKFSRNLLLNLDFCINGNYIRRL